MTVVYNPDIYQVYQVVFFSHTTITTQALPILVLKNRTCDLELLFILPVLVVEILFAQLYLVRLLMLSATAVFLEIKYILSCSLPQVLRLPWKPFGHQEAFGRHKKWDSLWFPATATTLQAWMIFENYRFLRPSDFPRASLGWKEFNENFIPLGEIEYVLFF